MKLSKKARVLNHVVYSKLFGGHFEGFLKIIMIPIFFPHSLSHTNTHACAHTHTHDIHTNTKYGIWANSIGKDPTLVGKNHALQKNLVNNNVYFDICILKP